MKNLIVLLLIIIPSFIAQHFFAWWSFAPIVLVLGFVLDNSAKDSFYLGFLGIAALWLGVALYYDIPNHGLMASKIGLLFGGLNHWALVGIVPMIGGLLGGLFMLAGRLGRNLVAQ